MNTFFEEIKSQLGSVMSDEHTKELKNIGEKFYNNIDLDLYAPKEASEENHKAFLDSMCSEEKLMRIKYEQLKATLRSGMLESELTDEEIKIIKHFDLN